MVDLIDGETGEVIPPEKVEESYTREGRRAIGKEYPNPIPMAPPIGYVPQKPIYEQIRDMVRREMSQAAADEDLETMEEADDFDVGDDFDPSSPYEENFEPQDPWPPSKAVAEIENEIARETNHEPGSEVVAPPRNTPPSQSPSPGGAGGTPAEGERIASRSSTAPAK